MCLGNLLISGRKTLILSKAKGGGTEGSGRLEGFKKKEKVMSRVQIVAVGTSSFALIKSSSRPKRQ